MDARRGFVPEDEINFSPDNIEILKIASKQVLFLLNEGYDLKKTVTFVGNHYLLSERQRLAIMRSVATEDQLAHRKKKRVCIDDLFEKSVWIDGFNTIITLEVMHSRSILFECMDGTIRDLAALRGTYRIIPETDQAIRTMFKVLQNAKIKEAKILLDQPVSNSGRLKTLIAEIAEEYMVDSDIIICRDVDRRMYGKEYVVTSDSIVLDRCRSWFNIAAECIAATEEETICVWKK